MKITLNRKYDPLFRGNFGRYAVLTGGRGSGKSFAVATYIANELLAGTNIRILYLRYTMVSTKNSIVEEFLSKIKLMGLEQQFRYSKSDDSIEAIATGSKLIFSGLKGSTGDNTAKLKSIEGVSQVVFEEAEELIQSESIVDTVDFSVRHKIATNRIIFVLNPSTHNHWIYTRFFENIVDTKFNGIHEDTLYIHTTYKDNIKHLSSSFLSQILEVKRKNYRKYLHLFEGEWILEVEGALWTPLLLKDIVATPPALRRTVIAIDPAVTANKKSDATGIIVAGEGVDDRYYILHDGTHKYTTGQWARRVRDLYRHYDANYIVAEKNQGGDLIKDVIKQGDPIPVKLVHATKGKLLRAEPVVSLYEDDRVRYAHSMHDLDVELLTYTGDRDASPNRLDAMVYALLELSGGGYGVNSTSVKGLY
jgi:PBSX family phage terminase large subunit